MVCITVLFFYYVIMIRIVPQFSHDCLQKSLTWPYVPFTQLDKGGSENFSEQKSSSAALQVIDSQSTPN